MDRKDTPVVEQKRRSLQVQKTVRLNPRAFARVGESLPKLAPLPRDETTGAVDPTSAFKTFLPADFDGRLLDAVARFDIRREQVLSSRDWKTVTCVTITRGMYRRHVELDNRCDSLGVDSSGPSLTVTLL